MNKFACAVAILLLGCNANQVNEADQVQMTIQKLCSIATPLVDANPSVGVYVIAACSSEEMIAKISLDPNTIAWLQKLIVELKMAAVNKTVVQ